MRAMNVAPQDTLITKTHFLNSGRISLITPRVRRSDTVLILRAEQSQQYTNSRSKETNKTPKKHTF